MLLARLSLFLLAPLALVACGDDDAPRVPLRTTELTPPTEADDAAFEPRRGESFATGMHGIQLEGLAVPGAAKTHALFVIDLDRDQDRDGLLVRVDETGARVGVVVATRDGGQFVLRELSPLPLDGCTVAEASITHVTPSSFVAEARVTCPATSEATTESSLTHHWLVSQEAVPRARLLVSTRTPATLRFAFEDLDDDGHEDVRGTLALDGRELALRWLDRPGGLAFDASEPSATLEAAMRESPELGASLAAALCRGDQAVVRLGPGTFGLECPEAMVGAARVAETDALLRAGRLVDALVAIDRGGLASPAALDAAAQPGVVMERSPFPYRGEPSLDAAHLALAFVGTDLRVQGASIDRVSPDGSASPADAELPPIRSSDEAPWTLVRLRAEPCGGARVSLAAWRDGTLGPEHELALDVCDPTAAPTDARSPWRVLGWAPQGLVAARLGQRRVLPVTSDGLAAGAPMELDADAPWPAPVRGPRITPDGSTWILERAEGVLVFRDDAVSLWRPEGWSDGPAPTAAALSQDGATIAVLRGDAIWILRAR